MRRSTATRPEARGAADVLAADDAAAAARIALRWLRQRAGIERALVYAADEGKLEALAWAGIEAADALVPIPIDAGHPLALALASQEAVWFGPAARLRPETPLGDDPFHAMPLAFPEAGPQALGLLLHTGASVGQDGMRVARGLAAHLLARRHARFQVELGRLRRERSLFQAVFDAVTDPILLTDADGRILLANAPAESLFSATEEESQGRRRAVALNNMLFSASLIPAAGGGARAELPLVHPVDGRDLLFEVLSTKVEDKEAGDGMVSVLRDVSDLRRATHEIEDNYRRLRAAEAEVRAERDRLDLIIDSVADPILVTDPTGNIVLMNPPAEQLFAAPTVSDAAALERGERAVRANDVMFSSFVSNLFTAQADRWRGELLLVDPATGGQVPVEAIAGKVTTRNRDMAIVTILHDRTEAVERARLFEQVKHHSEELREKVREATAELVRQNELLQRQALELEQASAHKSQFLANMSHELRTPLNAVIGYTSLLLKGLGGELSQKQRDKLERIQANAQHLLKIISDLLDISRIEAGKMPLHLEQFRIQELLGEVVAEVEPLIVRATISFAHGASSDLPEVRTDRQKIKQVLINLISNAIKFTPAGSVDVRARFDPATDRIVLTVADTGIGISPDDQAKLFEAFRQLDSSYTRQFGGTGLGLAICRRLAATLEGRISVESQLGKGSTFKLEVPRWLESSAGDGNGDRTPGSAGGGAP